MQREPEIQAMRRRVQKQIVGRLCDQRAAGSAGADLRIKRGKLGCGVFDQRNEEPSGTFCQNES